MSSTPRFARKSVVITGASAGVGRATAHAFARAGANLMLIARDEKSLEETKAELGECPGKVEIRALDVADADAVFAAAQDANDLFGAIDIWVNNAMLTVFSPVSEMSPAEFRRVTEVTYLGFVHGTMAALRYMRPRNSGRIVQVGSALAYRGIPLQSAYCGAKHAIRGFTDSLRSELIHERSKVSITMVQLPAVNTPQFSWARVHMEKRPRPVAPVFAPEVAAEAVLKAAVGRAREYWLGLSTLKVILGAFVAPGLLDRYLAKAAISGQKEGALPDDRPENLRAPVTEIHATRGRFGNEARRQATLFTGTGLRLGGAAIGAAFLAGLLALTATANSHRRRAR